MRRRAISIPSLGLLGALCALALSAVAGPVRGAATGSVIVLPTTGVVDGVMADYLVAGIGQAVELGAPAVVVKLNTPGGSLDATQRITTAFLESKVPVIVWVAPAGGRAASAGTFITLSANLSFMAPGTNIGAASPISSTGGDIGGTLGVKVLNDAIANISSIAVARGRPVAWAASTVAEARSYSAADAVAAGAVDGIAASLDDVLAAANGRSVTVAGSPVTLALAGVPTTEEGMNLLQAFLHDLADPDLAFVLFVVGVLGIAFEFHATNFLTGTLGGIAILFSLVGFGNLPVNVLGILLVGIGLILIVAETQITSHGLLSLGAAICVALGAATFYTTPGAPTGPDVSVALPVIVVVTGMTGGFGLLVAFAAVRVREMRSSPVLVGSLRVVGEPGKVARPINPVGSVVAAGEVWTARSAGGEALERGARIRVVRQDGLTLIVEPATEPAAPGPSGAVTTPARPVG